MGWRFLNSPAQTLFDARVAFIGLNPGGSGIDTTHGEFAMNTGCSAYRDESWAGYRAGKSRLQREVLSLFDRLGENPEAVLSGNLVPFRSPNWASLKDKRSAVRFGEQLWEQVLKRARPQIVVTMGVQATQSIGHVLKIANRFKTPIGWGAYTASKGRFDGGWHVGLPHLSTFTIMNRAKSKPYLDALFSFDD